MTRRGLLLAFACLLAPLGLRAAALRNVYVDPAFLCPGQAFTLHYEASAKINTDMAAGAFIGASAAFAGCPATSDWHFLWGSYPGGTGSGVTPTSCVNTYDALATVHPGDSIVAYRPYTAVGRVPYGYATGTNLVISIAVNDGYSSYAGWGGYQKITIAAEVSCYKKVAKNQGGFWYADSNSVAVIIQTDPASCGTATFTPTFTATRTSTPTRTLTATPTLTATYTATPSASPTRTQTATPSATPTYTSTKTMTDTFTPSATRTITATHTPTSTVTFSATNTFSPGPSPTPSATPTHSPTRTNTSTATHTPTHTPTATQTVTFTYSYTKTETATVTPTVTITTPFTSTNTPTATPSATQSNTFTPSQTYTDSPTATPTFTPSSSATPSQTFTDSPTATPSFTPSATRTVTPTGTPTRTMTASFTDSPTHTVSPTITETPIPSPYKVTVTLYNAAGERVRVVFDGTSSVLPTDVKLSAGVIRSGLDQVDLDMGGRLSSGGTLVSWRGQNDSGQPVSGGTYYFKVEYSDPFGSKTSFIKGIQVLEGKAGNHMDVFNSAGELVYRADFSALTRTVTSFSLNKDVLLESYLADGTNEDAIRATFVLDDNTSFTADWDGRSGQGVPLDGGTYNVVLVAETQSGTQVSSRSVTLVKNASTTLSTAPFVCPNPATSRQGGAPVLQVSFPASELVGATAVLYNQAGERVAAETALPTTGQIWFDYAQRASGVYLVVLEGHLLSGAPYRKVLKVAIVR